MTAPSERQREEVVAGEWQTEGVFTKTQALSRHLLHQIVNEISVCGLLLFLFSTMSY